MAAVHFTQRFVKEIKITGADQRFKDKRGLIRNDLLAVLLDNELLLGYLLVESVDVRLRRRDIGTRLVECRLVIAWIDPREHRPSLDRLVVVDRSRGDVA